MFVACVIVSSLVAFLALGSGLAKLRGVPQVTVMLQHIGAARLAKPVGVVEVLGAAGLVVGLVVAPVGIVAAAVLVAVFAAVTGAHIRVKDPMTQWLNPAVPAVLGALAMWLRVATT